MGGKRRTQAKKCSECGKLLRKQNKSGLCSHHLHMKLKKEKNQMKLKKHICVECDKKVEPIITYPAGNTIPPITKYTMRCYECREKRRMEYGKSIKNKLEKKDVTTQE